MGVGGQRHATAALRPGKRPGTNCTRGCVVPRAGLDGWGKSRPPPEFDPRTVQLVACRSRILTFLNVISLNFRFHNHNNHL